MYSYPVRVQFEDIDVYNIAHHTKIICYLERARVNFFSDRGFDVRNAPYGLVLRNINIKFRVPLLMLDDIVITLQTKDIGNFKFIFYYEVLKNGVKHASAEIEMAVIDLETKKPKKIPDLMMEMLKSIEIENS